MTQRVGLIPVIVDVLFAIKNPSRADIQQRNMQFTCNEYCILDRNGIGAVGIVRVNLTILQIRVGAQMKEIVRFELHYVFAVRLKISEIQKCQPSLIDLDIRTLKD